MTDQTLRALVDLRDRQIQKARIQFGNRLAAIDNSADPSSRKQRAIVDRWHGVFEQIEEELDRDIADLVRDYPIFDRVTAVKGIGPMLAAKLIAMIDIERADTPSALWRFAGYGVVDGQRERPVKGEKLHYNTRLKTTCYLIGTSFLKAKSPYRDVYDKAKEDYDRTRPEWTKAHKHQAAMRVMIKRFLVHLWLVWRETEGLPTRTPYVQEYMGHTHIDLPEDYGW